MRYTILTKKCEQRRQELLQLLTNCIDAKCLHGGTERAKQLARKAYGLAQQMPELWQRLASYRLAHLMLRDGDRRNLPEVDKLLEFAAGISSRASSTPLGPLPAIFRLAVLHRRWLESKSSMERTALTTEVQRTFETAQQDVRLYAFKRHDQEHEPNAAPAWGVQEVVFNLLELATYFLGEKYEGLEGLGHFDVLRPKDNQEWILLGSEPATATISVTREFALAELEDWESQTKHGIVVLVPETLNDAEMRLVRSKKGFGNPKWTKLVALLAERGSTRRADLCRSVVGSKSENPRAAFRKMLQRLGEEVEKVTRKKGLRLLENDGQSVRLSGELAIIGAAHRATLHSRPKLLE